MFHHPKSREEWLILRHRFVGSTDSPALFKASPYLTAFELAVTLQQPEPTALQMSERTAWGERMQLAIATAIRDDYGVKVRLMSAYAVLEPSSMGASFDYEIVGVTKETVKDASLRELYQNHGPGVLEIKNVDRFEYMNKWAEHRSEDGVVEIEAPAHIEIQGQHQLHCCERGWMVFGVLVGGNDLKTIVRYRDLEFGHAIEHKVREFKTNLMRGLMPPAVLPDDLDSLRLLYARTEPGKVVDLSMDEALRDLCIARQAASAEMSAAKKLYDNATGQLLQKIGDAELVLAPGYQIKATPVKETLIAAHLRKGYRRITVSAAEPVANKEKLT